MENTIRFVKFTRKKAINYIILFSIFLSTFLPTLSFAATQDSKSTKTPQSATDTTNSTGTALKDPIASQDNSKIQENSATKNNSDSQENSVVKNNSVKQDGSENKNDSNLGKTPEETPEKTKEEIEQENKINEAIAEEIDNQIVAAITQIKKVDSCLEELAQIIQNGLVKTKNKARLILQIKALRKFIDKIANAPLEEADFQTINFILVSTKYLIDKIVKAINTNFKSMPDIDINEIQKIMGKSKLTSPEELTKKFSQNEIDLEKLDKTVSRAGLTWVNIAYRNFVYAPAKFASKYHLTTVAKWSAIFGVIATYAVYRSGQSKKIKKIFGKPAEYDHNGVISNAHKVKTLGSLEDGLLKAYKQPITKLIIALSPLFYASLKTDFTRTYKEIKNWAKLKLENLHYKLMGGTYEKNQKKSFRSTTPRYTFDDVVGMENVKRDLKPLIEFIKNPGRFERVGVGPEKGYLFAGKPGTGKSFMAEALAGEILAAMKDVPGNNDTLKFIPLEASEIYQLITENGISDAIDMIFDFAKDRAPCVVFIDEPDLLGLQRTANKELLSKFLNAINGYLSNNISENVILLAATNRPDNLDPALLRRGRLGKIIHFEYPTYEARKDYLEKKLNPIVSDINDFNIEKLAKESDGTTFEGLQSIVRKAFQETRIKGVSLTQKILENALNEEVRQILPESKELSEKEINIVAASQAGSALANILLDTPDKLACVTINPVLGSIRESSVWDRYYKDEEKIIQQGKVFTYREKDSSDVLTEQELLNNCKILLAESVGQEILLSKGGQTYNKVNSEKAMKIAMSIATNNIYTENMPKQVLAKYYEKATGIIENCKKEIHQLLEKNKEKLEKLYKALLKEKTMDAKDIMEIIK